VSNDIHVSNHKHYQPAFCHKYFNNYLVFGTFCYFLSLPFASNLLSVANVAGITSRDAENAEGAPRVELDRYPSPLQSCLFVALRGSSAAFT
jgi:hypothetical protein